MGIQLTQPIACAQYAVLIAQLVIVTFIVLVVWMLMLVLTLSFHVIAIKNIIKI
jgi:hypothetical protein